MNHVNKLPIIDLGSKLLIGEASIGQYLGHKHTEQSKILYAITCLAKPNDLVCSAVQ